ncbi:MAG: response regulator [Ignavibacteriae bacterium]|nr:response regulator [Ignavibacteriota bacterium]
MALGQKSEMKPVAGKPLSAAADDKRQIVGTHLRNADKYIKEGRLSEAREELQKVRDLDPNNAYAFAFVERINDLEKQKKGDVGTSAQPSTPAAPAVTKPVLPEQPKAVNVEALKVEIEKKLEEEYRERFTKEIQKAEQGLLEELAREEEKHAEERTQLLEQLQKEKTTFQNKLEQQFQSKLQEEVQKAQTKYREQFEAEKKQAEREIKTQVETQYQLNLKELEALMEEERKSLEQKEKQTIEAMKKQLDADFSRRLTTEIENVRKSSKSQQEQMRVSLEDNLKNQFKKDMDAQVAQERVEIENKFRSMQKEVEQNFKEKHQQVVKESERLLEQRLKEMREKEQKKFEDKRIEIQKNLERDYLQKLEDQAEEEKKKFEEKSQQLIEQERKQFDKEKKQLLEQEQVKLEKLRSQLKTEKENELDERMEQAQFEIAQSYEHRLELLGFQSPKTRDEKIKLYHDKVRDAWKEGPLTLEKAQRLMELQEILGLGFDDHAEIESDVRLRLYVDSVELGIRGGKVKAHDVKALDELKKRFDITAEESMNLEPLILQVFQRASTKATILLVDDDETLLNIISDRLQEIGYNVIAMSTLAEATTFIESNTIDLILSDIRFQGEKIDGFTFFKRVQQHVHLRKIPFIFMSALDEGLFIRTGVQLGVDDYLTKPIDIDLLAAVVEGKLKKYRAMMES